MKHEKEIIKELALGGSSKTIAAKFKTSHRTIERHIEVIKAKHNASNTPNLIYIAVRQKIIK